MNIMMTDLGIIFKDEDKFYIRVDKYLNPKVLRMRILKISILDRYIMVENPNFKELEDDDGIEPSNGAYRIIKRGPILFTPNIRGTVFDTALNEKSEGFKQSRYKKMRVYDLEIEFKDSKEILRFTPKYAYLASSYIGTRVSSLKDFDYQDIKVYTKDKMYIVEKDFDRNDMGFYSMSTYNNYIKDDLEFYKMCCNSQEITIESNAPGHHLQVVRVLLEINDRRVEWYIK